MRENRTCGSEGGEAQSLPYPYPGHRACCKLLVTVENVLFGRFTDPSSPTKAGVALF